MPNSAPATPAITTPFATNGATVIEQPSFFGSLTFGAPDFLAGLDVERDHVGVERRAVELAVEQRGAAVDDAATNDLVVSGAYSITFFQICFRWSRRWRRSS